MAPVDARRKIEELKRRKGKNAGNKSNNVKDLRQIIAKKGGRVSKPAPRDLRETNKNLEARRSTLQARDGRTTRTSARAASMSSKPTTSRGQTVNGPASAGRLGYKSANPVREYYVPPHMQAQQQPTYIIASPAAPQSNLAMDNVPEAQGASVLISNLLPAITQSDIIELFGDIGVLTSVNMINQTTALVTYQNSCDAVRAIKVFHNRLLDGKPMLVNMMPNSAPTSNVRSRIALNKAHHAY